MRTKKTKKKKQPKYEKRVIELKNRIKQTYYINPKGPIAEYIYRDKKICVNDAFLKLSLKEKQTIIYHERGHFKESTLKIQKISNFFLFLFTISLLYLAFLIGNSLGPNLPIIIPLNLDILLIILSLTTSMGFIWLNEVACDFNAIKNMGKELTIKTIGDIYKKKKSNFWKDYVLHPPWSLRKKIMEELD